MKELTTQHIHITTHPMYWSCVSSHVLFMSIILWQYDFDCYNSLCFWLLFRNSDVLVLPSRRTLRDCRNVIKLTVGFYPKVIAELFSVTKDFCGKNMFVQHLMKWRYNQTLCTTEDSHINYVFFWEGRWTCNPCINLLWRWSCNWPKMFVSYFATKGIKLHQIISISF